MDQKRAVLRRRTYFAAQISSQDGIVWAEGVVRNLTEGGAMIEALNAPIPDSLDIVIPMAGVRTRARVVWRAADRAGLQFQQTAPRSAPPATRLRRLQDDPNY